MEESRQASVELVGTADHWHRQLWGTYWYTYGTPRACVSTPICMGVKLTQKVGAHSFPSSIPSILLPSSFPPSSPLHFPAPFPPFLSSLPSHPFPLSCPPPVQLGGLESAVSSPSGVRGTAPAANVFCGYFKPKNVPGGSDFCFVL